MAQTKVSEFFPIKKRLNNGGATKKRKVELNTIETEDSPNAQRQSKGTISFTTKARLPKKTKSVKSVSQTRSHLESVRKTKSVKSVSQTRSHLESVRKSSRKTNQGGNGNEVCKPNLSEFFSTVEVKNASFNFTTQESEAAPLPFSCGTPTKLIKLTTEVESKKVIGLHAADNCEESTPQNESSISIPIAQNRQKQSKKEICGNIDELKSRMVALKKSQKLLKKQLPLPKGETVENIAVAENKPNISDRKAPAYERFHSLASPSPPTLSLPYKYKLLLEMFRGMDMVVSMMHNRSEICTFSKLKVAVQTMTKRNFEKKTIGQIKTVYTTAYNLCQERVPTYGQTVGDYQLTVEANLKGTDNKKDNNPSFGESFTPTHILQRRHTFHSSLISIVKHHHKNFLMKLDRPLNIPDSKITRWHPKFALDQIADIPVAVLPEAPNVQKFQSARDVLEQSRRKLNPRLELALSSVAKNLPAAVNLDEKQEPKKVTCAPPIKGIPLSLLEKIRAKEAKKLEASLTSSPAEDKKKEMMARLPDIMRIIRSFFVTEKKPSIQLEVIVQKLVDSSKSCISKGDMEAHMKLLVEVLPEWLTMIQIKKGRYIKINKNIDIQVLFSKIGNRTKP